MTMLTLSFLLVAMTALTRAGEATDVEKRGLFCESGWTRYGWRCYHFVPDLMSWADAEKKCKSMDARLASVQSADDYHWIQKMIADQIRDYPKAWLGATDNTQGGTWSWTDGSDFKFAYWCQGKPNSGGNQYCLQMNHSAKKCWSNVSCINLRASVCAKKIWTLVR